MHEGWPAVCAPPGAARRPLKVVREMNRLGMIVDLSHVGENTTRAAIKLSRAPVVFTHSSVYSLCNHKRNVPDDIIHSLKENGGIIMVNFFPDFVKCAPNATISDVAGKLSTIVVLTHTLTQK
uniref:Dipeptidase n=1 Tax=Spodoptera frugiperda TaxID=7108 RepID=A0A2H1WZY1_SPOFR